MLSDVLFAEDSERGLRILSLTSDVAFGTTGNPPAKRWRKHLIRFFSTKTESLRYVEEHLYHLELNKNWQRLRRLLVDLHVFRVLWTSSVKTRQDLYRSWTFLMSRKESALGKKGGGSKKKNKNKKRKGEKEDKRKETGQFDVIDEYGRALSNWYNNERPSTGELTWTLQQLSSFFFGFGQFEEMMDLPPFLMPDIQASSLLEVGIKLNEKVVARLRNSVPVAHKRALEQKVAGGRQLGRSG